MQAASSTIPLRAETEVRAKQAAQARGETLEAFVDHALREAIEEQAAFEEAMAEADRDFEAGRVHSYEEVMEWLRGAQLRAEAEIARRNAAA